MIKLIIILNVVSLLFSGALAIYAFRIKNNVIALSFAILMSIFSVWGLLKIIGLLVGTAAIKIKIFHFIRAVTTFTPALILFIVIHYTQYPAWFKNNHSKFFFTIPAILGILSVTLPLNDSFFLFYLYTCLTISLFILIRNLVSNPSFFNKQLIFIIIAIALPAINDILFRFHISIIPGSHLTPEMFIVGNIFFAWALFGHRFLKLTPITHEMVINSIDDIMIAINRDNLIVGINKSCNQKFKISYKNSMGKPFEEVFSEYPHFVAFCHNPLEKELCLEIDNQENYYSVRLSLVKLINSEIVATVILLHDITKIKQAEIQIKEYTKKLEELNATKNKFFSILGHDLRNPCIGINGISDIILSDYDKISKNEMLNMIGMIKKSSQRGYNLLENLLQWARMQTHSVSFEPVKIRLNEIVGPTLETLFINAHNKNISITNQISNDIEIFADCNMVDTIVRNLVSNAIKFTNKNGSITIYARKSETNRVEISVIDNGVGITRENIEKLFRIESKFTSPGTDNETGTALGLILCKEFVEKNSGKIWIESEPGKGTKVFFTLPAPLVD